MEAFELRLWDGRLGRWLTTDPYGEFDSPYLGMGNNPISLIDPDGGSTEGGPGDPPVNGGTLNEVVISTTRVGKFNDIDKILNFVPKQPIFKEPIAPRYSDDFFWNKLAYDGTRRAAFGHNIYQVDNDGYAVKFLNREPVGGAGALAFIGGGGQMKLFKYLTNPNQVKHIFRTKAGHVNPATIEGQLRYLKLFEKVSSDSGNLVKTLRPNKVQAGIQTFMKTTRSGKQIWVETIGGKIHNAGVNNIPRI